MQPYSESEIVKFLSQIGKTLSVIYTDEGIAHRDIKPSNILTLKGNYILSDFGCAQEIFSSEDDRNNMALGTIKWMSPEVREMQNNQKVDFFKSDVFSLGMVLLYMLTLSDISQVNSDETKKKQKLRLMNSRKKDLKLNILLLVSRMLETDPDNRPDPSILKIAIENIEREIQNENINQQNLNNIYN